MKRFNIGLSLFFSLILLGCVNIKFKGSVWNPPPYYALERYTEIQGVKICYLEWGTSNPEAMVFIHGLSGNVQNWWDQFEEFRDDYRVVVPDLPGHGKSEKPEDFDYSVPNFANIVIQLMDQLNIQKAHIIGNSMGGAIAGYLAIHYPDRVERLVLSDSAGIKSIPLLNFVPLVTPLSFRLIGTTSAKQYKGISPKQRARAEMSASFRNTREELPYLKALDKALSQLAKIDLTDDLSKIQAKTLLIWGDNDNLVPLSVSKTFLKNIPNSQLYVVKKGTHTPNMNKPKEFNCALQKFLNDQSMDDCHNLK